MSEVFQKHLINVIGLTPKLIPIFFLSFRFNFYLHIIYSWTLDSNVPSPPTGANPIKEIVSDTDWANWKCIEGTGFLNELINEFGSLN